METTSFAPAGRPLSHRRIQNSLRPMRRQAITVSNRTITSAVRQSFSTATKMQANNTRQSHGTQNLFTGKVELYCKSITERVGITLKEEWSYTQSLNVFRVAGVFKEKLDRLCRRFKMCRAVFPTGAPRELSFDHSSNLILQD